MAKWNNKSTPPLFHHIESHKKSIKKQAFVYYNDILFWNNQETKCLKRCWLGVCCWNDEASTQQSNLCVIPNLLHLQYCIIKEKGQDVGRNLPCVTLSLYTNLLYLFLGIAIHKLCTHISSLPRLGCRFRTGDLSGGWDTAAINGNTCMLQHVPYEPFVTFLWSESGCNTV